MRGAALLFLILFVALPDIGAAEGGRRQPPDPKSPKDGGGRDAEETELDEPGPLGRFRLPSMPYLQSFNATDASPGGLHTTLGFKKAFAPTLDQDAWLLTVMLGSGLSPATKEDRDPRDPATSLVSARMRMLVGRQVGFDKFHFAGHLGAEAEAKTRDPVTRRTGRSYGLRVEAQTFFRPTEAVAASFAFSAGSAARDVWTRGRVGRKILGPVTLGPELVFSAAAPGYADGRLGLFLSDIPIFRTTIEGSAGRMRDSDGRNGWYGTIVTIRRF